MLHAICLPCESNLFLASVASSLILPPSVSSPSSCNLPLPNSLSLGGMSHQREGRKERKHICAYCLCVYACVVSFLLRSCALHTSCQLCVILKCSIWSHAQSFNNSKCLSTGSLFILQRCFKYKTRPSLQTNGWFHCVKPYSCVNT